MWDYELETVIETFVTTYPSKENYYYWFIYDGINKIKPMDPIDNLESGRRRRYENRQYLIDNK